MDDCTNPSVGKFLLLFALQKLPADAHTKFEQHLKRCSACQNDPLLLCTEPELGSILFLYACDELPGKNKRRVKRHLPKCQACHDYLALNQEHYNALKDKQKRMRQQLQRPPYELVADILKHI